MATVFKYKFFAVNETPPSWLIESRVSYGGATTFTEMAQQATMLFFINIKIG